MLELKRQFLIEPVSLAVGFQVLHGCFDETLSNLESSLDLDPRRGARVEDRDATGEERGKKIDRSNGEEKLRSDGPVIPKFLQHESQVSRAPMPPHNHARKWHTLRHDQFPIFLEHPWFFVSHLPISLFLRALADRNPGEKPHCMSEVAKTQCQAWQYDCQTFPITIARLPRDGRVACPLSSFPSRRTAAPSSLIERLFGTSHLTGHIVIFANCLNVVGEIAVKQEDAALRRMSWGHTNLPRCRSGGDELPHSDKRA